ncbi:hypothetical protein ACVNIS_06455 [Sphaerotilaceae bacterium SBD11-9]
MDVTLPDGRVIADVPEGTTKSELMRRVGALDNQVKAQRAAAMEAEHDQRMRQTVSEMSMPEKWAANWSAGYGNLTQGIDQLLHKVGIGPGVSDEAIREKRRRDAYLKEGNWGLGVMQLGGEALPTMAVPVGSAAQPLMQAGKVAIGPLTRLLGASAAGGAAGASLAPVTSDESRGVNMATAAAIGAVLPGAGAAAPATVRGARKLLTEAGAKTRAVEAIADMLPGNRGAELADKLRNYQGPTLKGQSVDVPISAAQASGDARLAQAEAASRSRPNTQPDWADFDAAQNAQRFDLVTGMAPSELRLDRLDRARTLSTSPMRRQALQEAAERGGFAEPVLAHAQGLIQGASGANPAVEGVAKYVQRTLGPDAAGAVTPARLYEVRKTLAAKLSGPAAIGDELAASAKGARAETTAMISAIDDALAGGAKEGSTWGNYLAEYSNRSKPIASGRAQRDVLEKLETKPLKGNAPEVTAAGYGQAVRQFGEGKYGDKLTPSARIDADNFLDHLKQAEAASRTRKSAATMGGGSITNTDQLLGAAVTKAIHSIPGVGGYASRLGNVNREAVEREMARLLQSPGQLGDALRALPPDRLRGVYAEVLRGSGVGAGVESASP